MIRLGKLLRYVFNVKVSLYPYWQILGKSKTRDRHLAYFPGKSREKYLSIGIYFIALDFFLKSRSVKKIPIRVLKLLTLIENSGNKIKNRAGCQIFAYCSFFGIFILAYRIFARPHDFHGHFEP